MEAGAEMVVNQLACSSNQTTSFVCLIGLVRPEAELSKSALNDEAQG